MAVYHSVPLFSFIIDTDSYSGNFERELCAYITGVVGECEVGADTAGQAQGELGELGDKFDEIIEQVPDDHGCRRPVSIGVTPGFWNDGHGNHYPDSEWGDRDGTIQEKLREKLRTDAEKYKDGPNHWMYVDKIGKAEVAIPHKYPAYQSVEIFFSSDPRELVETMKERAHRFEARELKNPWDTSFKILGFRLVGRRIVEEELTL